MVQCRPAIMAQGRWGPWCGAGGGLGIAQTGPAVKNSGISNPRCGQPGLAMDRGRPPCAASGVVGRSGACQEQALRVQEALAPAKLPQPASGRGLPTRAAQRQVRCSRLPVGSSHPQCRPQVSKAPLLVPPAAGWRPWAPRWSSRAALGWATRSRCHGPAPPRPPHPTRPRLLPAAHQMVAAAARQRKRRRQRLPRRGRQQRQRMRWPGGRAARLWPALWRSCGSM